MLMQSDTTDRTDMKAVEAMLNGPAPKIRPGGEDAVLSQAKRLLDTGKSREAADLLRSHGVRGIDAMNLLGIALMRSGDPGRAVEIYRNIVIQRGKTLTRKDAPLATMVNYGCALLMTGNTAGCVAVLKELASHEDPELQRLRDAVETWRRGLSWYGRLTFRMSHEVPGNPVPIDFVPGAFLNPGNSATTSAVPA